MKQDSEIELREDGADTTARAEAKRLARPKRRAQVLRTASAQFAMTGLRGTSTLTLAQAAGISEAILYVHFGNKTQLFREAVEINSETRLRSLGSHLSSIAAENQINWIESMAEATMMICLDGPANAILMSWALLEAPEFAKDLYRNEIGSVRILWDREVARCFPASRTRENVSLHIVPYAVNTCLAHGLSHDSLRSASQNGHRRFSDTRRNCRYLLPAYWQPAELLAV